MFRAGLMSATRILFAPDPAGGAGGAEQAGSFGTLDAGMQKMVTDNGWKSPADAVKNYGELSTKLGSMVSIPGADAKPEDVAAFFGKLGVPASPDKYDLGDFKKPEGVPWDDGAQTAIIGELHKAGATPKVVQTALKGYGNFIAGVAKARDDAALELRKTAEPALRKTWGDQYDAKYAAANLAVRKTFGTDLEGAKQLRLEDGTYLLDHPNLAAAFAVLGGTMVEDSDLAGRGGSGGEGLGEIKTPAAAQAEIQKIRAEAVKDEKHPYNDRKHPDYQKMQKKMNDLYALAKSGHAAIVD